MLVDYITHPTPLRKTYPQDWPSYNAAQTAEKDTFMTLLANLCMGIRSRRTTSDGPAC